MSDDDKPKTTVDTAKSGGPTDVQTAWRILAGGAPVAAAALVDIAEHGKSEVARVQASTAILDRVGLAPPKEIFFRAVPSDVEDHGIAHQLSPAEVIRKRLADLSGPTKALLAGVLPDEDEADPEVVEAELMPMSEALDPDGGYSEDPWDTP